MLKMNSYRILTASRRPDGPGKRIKVIKAGPSDGLVDEKMGQQ